MIKKLIFSLLISFSLVAEAAKLNVGIVVDPPFVIQQNERYTGVSIAIWEKVAEKANLEYRYQLFANEDDVIKAYNEGTL
ncbi:transporter substrate-binding domain-containing protein [Legionella impletisoli]|uniref:Uncharacterized protein n=1 Tax=Legionella impletisoli TaxID=343510 RepID=A0A917JZ79_9GAMM|nr:transporter substrate-binding domain-containing protein [Legionella impletisoli]GGI93482.1 hypothetical protein GCM10007966_22570 [Legionella impletisoli]